MLNYTINMTELSSVTAGLTYNGSGFYQTCVLNQIEMMNQVKRLPIGLFIFLCLMF